MRDYLRIAFDRVHIGARKYSALSRLLQRMTSYPARWRLEHDFYELPFELWINRRLKRILPPPKPNGDTKRLEPATQASCS